ncbi:MAG: ThiF family adenylyltransferase [candidate division NC10 bacterium]|nr:ThiF family adenylyltransferase [candidate division NC10 bacterium]
MLEERLDRQLRIEGWDQRLLTEARIGVVGDDDLLVSLYAMSSSALGLNNMVVIAPRLDDSLLDTARRINPAFNMILIEGYYTHPVMDDIFTGCTAIVDLSQYGLANKLLLKKGFEQDTPIIRGFCYAQDDQEGFKVFTYVKGREWQDLEQIVSRRNLPNDHSDDGVLDIIGSGVVLEQTKNVLMGRNVSEDVIGYNRKILETPRCDPRICVVGAGALGNFVGLGLAYSGLRTITIIDPDLVEMTNLNRQVFLYDAIGLSKAETLSERLNRFFGTHAQPRVMYFRKDTDISPYDVIFDCVDNFETRIVLSEKCKDEGKVLISGGTNSAAGQVVVFDPSQGDGTPAELLGLYDIVDKRRIEPYRRDTVSCAYQADPAVIMTNQIIAGFMVDSYRMLLGGQVRRNIFYNSTCGIRI